MKQKQVKQSKNPKFQKKLKPVKKAQQVVEDADIDSENDDDDDSMEITNSNPIHSKNMKNNIKGGNDDNFEDDSDENEGEDEDDDNDEDDDEEDDEEQEQEVDDDDEQEAGDDEEQEVGEDEEEEDAGGEEDEEEIDEEDEDDDNEAEEEEDTDDDAPPSEVPIMNKVKQGLIPVDYPIEKVVNVKNLPKNCKQVDILESFTKFGPIHMIHLCPGKDHMVADVAFKEEEAVKAILHTKKPVTVKNCVVKILKKRPPKINKLQVFEQTTNDSGHTVYVKNLNTETTQEQLQAHFVDCGDIVNVKVVLKNKIAFAFVTFAQKESLINALKLHNSILNGVTIHVTENKKDHNLNNNYDPQLTVLVKNTKNFQSFEGNKLKSIFDKCGEIVHMDIICRKNVLAFITFKNEAAVSKAFQLNGKTEQGLQIELEAYNPDKSKTSIFVSNLSNDVTIDDLNELFGKCGEIGKVYLKTGYAIIFFKDSDAYCKSFLLNETILKNRMIFLEPHSFKKHAFLKKNKGMKRKFPEKNGGKRFNRNGGNKRAKN